MGGFIEARNAELLRLMSDTLRQFERELFNDGNRPSVPPPPKTWEDRYRERWMDEFNYEDDDY